MIIDHNLYWPASGKPVALYGVEWRVRHKTFTRVADFAQATGFDAHSQVTDPAFVNAAQGDYRLKPVLPARTVTAGWGNAPANVDKWITGWLPKWMAAVR